MRANAKKYNLDPARIGAWGASAGGHLVAMLGTTGDDKSFDKGLNLEQSSAVQAVCDFFGPTDFTKMSAFPSTMDHEAADSPESQLIGGPVQEKKEACARANPITFITRKDPPFLIDHGDKDLLVPMNQSQILYDALKTAGVEATSTSSRMAVTVSAIPKSIGWWPSSSSNTSSQRKQSRRIE